MSLDNVNAIFDEGFLQGRKDISWWRVLALCLVLGALLRFSLMFVSSNYFAHVPLDVRLRGVLLGFFYDGVTVATPFLLIFILLKMFRFFIPTNFAVRSAKILVSAVVFLFVFSGVIDVLLFQHLNTKMRLSLILNNWHQLGPTIVTVLGGGQWFRLTLAAALPLLLFILLRRAAKLLNQMLEVDRSISRRGGWFNFLFLVLVSFVWVNEPLWRLPSVAAQPEAAQVIASSGIYATGSDLVNTTLRGVRIRRLIPREKTSLLYQKYFLEKTNIEAPKEIRLDTSVGERKQNVVIILMEYMGAFLSRKLTPDEPGFTPKLDELASESISFARAFSSSTRTHHGFVSVLSGFPSILDTSVINKRNGLKIPTIATALPDYHSAFLYSGDIGFDGMDNFVIQGDFKELIGDKKLLEKNPNWLGKKNDWGYPDGLVFEHLDRHLENLYQQKIPSLTFVLTTSNHEPFQLPDDFYSRRQDLKKDTVEAGAAYADAMIGEFFQKAKAKPYYRDTIFVLVADHSRMRNPKDERLKGFHIPLLIHSPRLAKQNRAITQTVKQVDIPATVMGLLGRSFPSFHLFGRDLLSSDGRRSFAVSRDGKYFTYVENEFGVRLNLDTRHHDYLKLDQYGHATVMDDLDQGSKDQLAPFADMARIYLQKVYDVFQGIDSLN